MLSIHIIYIVNTYYLTTAVPRRPAQGGAGGCPRHPEAVCGPGELGYPASAVQYSTVHHAPLCAGAAECAGEVCPRERAHPAPAPAPGGAGAAGLLQPAPAHPPLPRSLATLYSTHYTLYSTQYTLQDIPIITHGR